MQSPPQTRPSQMARQGIGTNRSAAERASDGYGRRWLRLLPNRPSRFARNLGPAHGVEHLGSAGFVDDHPARSTTDEILGKSEGLARRERDFAAAHLQREAGVVGHYTRVGRHTG